MKSLKFWKFNKKIEKEEFQRKMLSFVRSRLKEYFNDIKSNAHSKYRLRKKSFYRIVKFFDKKIKLKKIGTQIQKKIMNKHMTKWEKYYNFSVSTYNVNHYSRQSRLQSFFKLWRFRFKCVLFSQKLLLTLVKIKIRMSKKQLINKLRLISRYRALVDLRKRRIQTIIFKILGQFSKINKTKKARLQSIVALLSRKKSKEDEKRAFKLLRQHKNVILFTTHKRIKQKQKILFTIRSLLKIKENIKNRFLLSKSFKKLCKAVTQSAKNLKSKTDIIKLQNCCIIYETFFESLKKQLMRKRVVKEASRRLGLILSKSIYNKVVYQLRLNKKVQLTNQSCYAFHRLFNKFRQKRYMTSMKRMTLDIRYDYLNNPKTKNKLLLYKALRTLKENQSSKQLAGKVALIYAFALLKKSYFSLKIYFLKKRIARSKMELVTKIIHFHRWKNNYRLSKSVTILIFMEKATLSKVIQVLSKFTKFNKARSITQMRCEHSKKLYFGNFLKAFIFSKLFTNLEKFLLIKSLSAHFDTLKYLN